MHSKLTKAMYFEKIRQEFKERRKVNYVRMHLYRDIGVAFLNVLKEMRR